MEVVRKFVIASERGITIASRDDVSEAVGAGLGRGLILSQHSLSPEFFDLRTGLAVELIQKLVNYRVRTAIIVASPGTHGERFAELGYEHATHPTVRFVRSTDEAIEWMRG